MGKQQADWRRPLKRENRSLAAPLKSFIWDNQKEVKVVQSKQTSSLSS